MEIDKFVYSQSPLERNVRTDQPETEMRHFVQKVRTHLCDLVKEAFFFNRQLPNNQMTPDYCSCPFNSTGLDAL